MAGNQGGGNQRIRFDGTAPTFDVQPSVVRDEAAEVPTFTTDGLGNTDLPTHNHNGTMVDLAVTGSCPTVTKFSYLLDETPIWVRENAPNPLRYLLASADDGVGINPAASQYRISRRDAANNPVVIVDWTTLGAGTTVGTTTQYKVNLFRNADNAGVTVPGIGLASGVYDMEARVTDRLGRPTSASRCVTLQVLPPGLKWGASVVSTGHPYAMASMQIGSGISAHLLNDASAGAAVMDTAVTNGAGEPVFIEVATAPLQNFTVTKSFVTSNGVSNKVILATPTTRCDVVVPPAACKAAPEGPTYTSPSSSKTESLNMFVRVFQGAGSVLGAEVPCANCTGTPPMPPAGSKAQFQLPGRGGVLAQQPPKQYIVMTLAYRSLALWPSDATSPANQPFIDFSLAGIGMTGMYTTGTKGCVDNGSDIQLHPTCTATGTVTPYRTLTAASVKNEATIPTNYYSSTTSTSPEVFSSGRPLMLQTTLLSSTLSSLPATPNPP
jgi:hypothetical protein